MERFFALVFFGLALVASRLETKAEVVSSNSYFEPQGLDVRTVFRAANSARDLSKECRRDLDLYVEKITKEKWAMEMFDATSKLQSGVLVGNFYNLGNFEQCLSIDAPQKDEETGSVHEIRGKYCLGTMKMPFTLSKLRADESHEKNINRLKTAIQSTRMGPQGIDTNLKWAACVPDTCNATEIEKFIGGLIEGVEIPMNFTDDMCQSKNSEPGLSSGAVITLVVFAIIAGLVCVSTIYDVYMFYADRGRPRDVLVAFSALTNGRKIISTSSNPKQLLCLNGVKAISMMWVIIGHSYATVMFGPVADTLDIMKWISQTSSMYIMGATVSVDSFFLAGGLLTAYTFMGAMKRGVKFNVPLYYLHRYIRITPAFAAIVLVHVTLLPYLGSGPIYPSTMDLQMAQGCQKNWWGALLQIQNYYNYDGMCVPQSWYLSVDMQLFLISPFLLWPLTKKPKLALALISTLCVLSMVACFVVGWHFKMGAFLTSAGGTDSEMDNMVNFMKYYYLPTHTRMPPYLIGIAVGYFVFKIKDERTVPSINKHLVLALWACSLATLCAVVFAGHDLASGVYERTGHTLYITFARPAWALALAWVIFACIFGYGGPIDWFLSAPIFQVLSKLSYSMYLVHYVLMVIKNVSSKVTYKFSDFLLMHSFWGDFWFSVGVGAVWALMFESPMITIERLIFGGEEKRKPSEENGLVEEKATV